MSLFKKKERTNDEQELLQRLDDMEAALEESNSRAVRTETMLYKLAIHLGMDPRKQKGEQS